MRLLRGTVAADAIVVSGPDTTRRLFAVWARGAAVARLPDGLFIRFATSRYMRAEEAAGEVFARVGAVFTNAELSREETARFPAHSIVRLRGGVLESEPLPSDGVSAGSLLDLDEYELVALVALAPPLAAPSPPPLAPPVVTRELLGVARAPDAERMVRRLAGKETDGGGIGASLQRMAGGVRDLFRARGASGGERAGGFGSRLRRLFASSGDRSPMPEQASSSLGDTFRSVANRLLLASRMASVLGGQQARYMARLLDLLEHRRLDEALRHAIPLSDDVVSSLSRVTFGWLRPRNDLSLNLGAPRPALAAAATIGGDFAERLRELYRQAAEQLEGEGEIERAAFVLADLLNASEEAVSLLERHGRLELAARLAEARGLAPDLVVRQWLVAGDRKRAVTVARRHNAFEAAVYRLERTHRELAAELRVEWAESLAARGAFAEAADVIWSVEAERNRARTWFDQAIERGGVSGARALGRKLLLVEEDRDITLRQLATLLEDREPELATARAAALAQLVAFADTPPPHAASALRLAVRARIADSARLPLTRREADVIAQKSGDAALRADLPPLPTAKPDAALPPQVRHVVRAADRGITRIEDAVMLESGLVALALGEAGCMLVRADGTSAARLSEPAYLFVLADNRDRALALAPRGESWRIARVDFIARTATYWRDARLAAFADSYDGATWFAATERELHAVDTTRERFESLWYNPDVGRVSRVVRVLGSLAIINAAQEVWQYELPSFHLRTREQREPDQKLRVPLPDGSIAEAELDELRGTTTVRAGRSVADRVVGIFEGSAVELVTGPKLIAVVLRANGGTTVHLIAAGTGRSHAELTFERSVARVRLQESLLIAWDDAGRVVVADIDRGILMRDLRV